MKKIFLFIVIFFSLIINVNAASTCAYKEQVELRQKAANIKRDYEIVTEHYEDENTEVNIDHFKISVRNLTEDFYIVVTNSIDKSYQKRYNYADAVDGVISFDWTNVNQIVTFTIKVYSSVRTNCANELYKTLMITTPRFNEFSDRSICYDIADFSLCQRFVTFDEITENEFINRTNGYLAGTVDKDDKDIEVDNTSLFTKVINFIKEYKWVFIAIVLVCGVSAGYLVIRKSNKQRKMNI